MKKKTLNRNEDEEMTFGQKLIQFLKDPETHKSALIFVVALVLFFVLAVLLLIGCGQGAM